MTKWTVIAPAGEANYPLIDPVRMKGWVGLVGWLTATVYPYKWLRQGTYVSTSLSGKYVIFWEGNGRFTAVAKEGIKIRNLRKASRQLRSTVTHPSRQFLATPLLVRSAHSNKYLHREPLFLIITVFFLSIFTLFAPVERGRNTIHRIQNLPLHFNCVSTLPTYKQHILKSIITVR